MKQADDNKSMMIMTQKIVRVFIGKQNDDKFSKTNVKCMFI
jgi:hypothetical protein